jgi:phosphogluconate dehydratase
MDTEGYIYRQQSNQDFTMATSAVHPVVEQVTERIRRRSKETREAYLASVARAAQRKPARAGLSCTNFAHGFAAFAPHDKLVLREARQPNIAIVSSYNDMLSAHQPFERYPQIIKAAARDAGAVAQFAGGTPAMCDGVTQGEPGMELSLFSRDVIAMATAVALSHNMFDAVLCLGICDKIVPGLVIGALHFGHLPTILVPGGPMPSGLPNNEKARIRQLFAQGKVGRDALLESEAQSYHSPGTCTFFGTANSNQMLMEIMGLHLPGAAFVNPNTPLRDALTVAAAQQVLQLGAQGSRFTPIGHVVDERAIVNGIVGLLATGGSTNHTIHLVAMAHAAGIVIDWDDFDRLSAVVPLLARIYPNGSADVNHFHAAGGMGFLIGQLLDGGLLHADVTTVAGDGGLARYRAEPFLDDGVLAWRPSPATSGDRSVLRPLNDPFAADGGLKLMSGNLGRAVMKTSAVKSEFRVVEAPAIVFDDQAELMHAFERGELDRDFVAVVRYQGPRANGMPELHKLTPPLGVLQDRGFKVALVTDGRMSGASGKVPAAIHVTPECLAGGPLAKVRNGDVIRVDGHAGTLQVHVADDELARRPLDAVDLDEYRHGLGRELFGVFRANAAGAEQGAMTYVSSPHPRSQTQNERERIHDRFALDVR